MSIKPYILGQVVARGGMAEVYRGLHVGQDGFRRLVAIKRILPHHSQNNEFTEMFKDEAHIGQRLQHANIVKVEGFDIIDGSASIIMEFVDGSDLRALLSALESRKLPPGKRPFLPNAYCAYIIAEAARGLHYAHTRRDDVTNRPLSIVHRDISPQNILISWEGEVKITDFGIAAAERDFKLTETKAGIVKGKYSYMSPEQISGKKCDPKTDIFALSVVLWEMLAMRRLFSAENEIEVIEMVRHCKIPTRLRDLNPDVSEELEAIVNRGLNKDPRRRYESMEAFEKTLRAYIAKAHPTVSAADLSTFVKDLLSEKREASQEEMRKILTSSQLPSASAIFGASKAREISFEDGPLANKASLLVGRSTSTANQAFKGQRSTQQTPRQEQNYSFKSGSTRLRGAQQASPNKKPVIFTAIAVILLGLVGLTFFKQYRNSAKQALTLTVRSFPSTVRIKLNDREYYGGKFFTSPIRLKLDPGLNSIEISRPGYTNQKFYFHTDDGPPKKAVTIKLTPNTNFAPIRLDYRGSEPVTVSVNDGFFRSTMIPPQSVEQLPDLAAGSPAKLVVISKERKQISTCNFTPTNSSKSRPLIIKITDSKTPCEVVASGKGGNP